MVTEHSGEDEAARLRVGVIAGSTRPGRQSRSVAEWVCARACADAYDQQFASDVLWGNPYGGTVSGYKALNAAHRSLMAAGVAPGPYPREHLSTTLIRMHPRRIAAHNIHQHRPGWHARDIAVEKAGQ